MPALWLGGCRTAGGADDDGSYRVLPGAAQLIYQKGVPHTDRQGRMQLALTSDSFLPRCAYESLPESLDALKAAGFNCFKPWNGLGLSTVLAQAHQSGLQLIKEMLITPCDDVAHPRCDPRSNAAEQIASWQAQVAATASDPGILAWYIEEEPTGCVNAPQTCGERLKNYQDFHAALKAVDPLHPSFNLDIGLPYARALATWNAMNRDGDIAAIDDYPFHKGNERTLASSVDNYRRLVELNGEAKPVWITVQAFAQPAPSGAAWQMPTPDQLRAEVFAAIVHGATGIFYFALDSWASRNAQVIGIAPSAAPQYTNHGPHDAVATPAQVAASAALWRATLLLNAELQRLQDVILSPTAAAPYRVAVRGNALSATPVRALLKRSAEGSYTLLLVNIDDTPLQLQLTLPVKPSIINSIAANGAGSPMPATSFTGGRLNDSIAGFGVRIYQFR